MPKRPSSRPPCEQSAVSRTILSVVRVLIASYFLAMATGLIFEPASRTFFDAVLTKQHAQLTSTAYLFITAFAIMVGTAVRPAALLLAVFIFWSGFVQFDLSRDPAALAGFWRDMALLGAVLLIAVTEPGGSKKIRLWAQPVTPRRIAKNRLDHVNGRSVRPANEIERKGHELTPVDGLLAFASAEDGCAVLIDSDLDMKADGDGENIFANLWDAPSPVISMEPVPA